MCQEFSCDKFIGDVARDDGKLDFDYEISVAFESSRLCVDHLRHRLVRFRVTASVTAQKVPGINLAPRAMSSRTTLDTLCGVGVASAFGMVSAAGISEY